MPLRVKFRGSGTARRVVTFSCEFAGGKNFDVYRRRATRQRSRLLTTSSSGIGGRKRDHGHSSSLAGANAGRRVFEDHAVFRPKPRQPRSVQVRFGIWLAVDDVVGGDHLLRNGQTGSLQSCGCQPTASGGHDGKALVRQARSAALALPAIAFRPSTSLTSRSSILAVSSLRIQLRSDHAYGLYGRPSVGQLHHALRVKPLLLRPDPSRCGPRRWSSQPVLRPNRKELLVERIKAYFKFRRDTAPA